MARLTTEQYKTIIERSFPKEERGDDLNLIFSMLLVLSEDLEAKEKRMEQIVKALRILAQRLPKTDEVQGEEASAEAPGEGAGGAAAGPRDQTPFPTGFKAGPNAAGPAAPAEAPAAAAAADEPQPEPEIPTPDVVGMPVPKVARVTRNGKGASAS